jgi:PiT family inorganic phosphate transporter
MGVFLMGVFLSKGYTHVENFDVPIWLIVICALVMGLGTSIGGMKIIKTVGMDMVKLEKYQGFSADTAAAGCLLVASLTGMPVSTTHTKTTAIMGVGAARRVRAVNWGVVSDMGLAWVLTFPGCGLIGFLMAKLFLRIF